MCGSSKPEGGQARDDHRGERAPGEGRDQVRTRQRNRLGRCCLIDLGVGSGRSLGRCGRGRIGVRSGSTPETSAQASPLDSRRLGLGSDRSASRSARREKWTSSDLGLPKFAVVRGPPSPAT